jgi:type VI secretion system protein ImpF
MAKIPIDQPLLPSVLDRLIDEHPGERDPIKGEGQVLRELKANIRRDLENLLNTRRRPTSWPEDLEELEHSLVDYGIPDITGGGFGSRENREDFLRTVEAVIQRFEPRFRQISIRMLENAEPMDRTLRFRIDAELHTEPAPEPVVFDTAMQPVTGNVEVKGTHI